MKDPTLKTQDKGDELEEALGLRSPGGNFFQEKKKKKRSVMGEGASASHITNTRPPPFIPHSLGGGQQRSHVFGGTVKLKSP